MERLCQPLITLALVIPGLAVPAFMPAALQQQLMNQQPINMAWDSIQHYHPHHSPTIISPSTIIIPSPTSTDKITTKASPPTELLKRKTDAKPDNIPCTPGDRYCHASLDHVLFCTDDRQWLTYSQCAVGTICHRLNMTCVTEVKPAIFFEPSDQHVTDEGPRQCKEGDRRCSTTFNRVDRCNSGHEWVTYHDCHLSERCDGGVGECLPLTSLSAVGMKPVMPNGSDGVLM